MSRKPKKAVDMLASLEALSRDESMPLAVREEAGRELIRLKVVTSPAPTPAPVPTPRQEISVEDIAAILTAAAKEHEVKSNVSESESVEKPKIDTVLTESKQFVIDAPERAARAKAAKDERERVERVRQAEASRPETIEEFQQRRQVEMRRARQEWAQAMGCPVQPEWPGV
jgi:hypothetical protein